MACLILVGSSRPHRNVGLFAAVYMAVYAAISTVVVAVGDAAGVSTDSPGTTRGWISLVVGVLFPAGGFVTWRKGTRRRPVERVRKRVGAAMAERAGVLPEQASDDALPDDAPAWVRGLADPESGLVIIASSLLSVVNPNVSTAEQVVGVLALLGASLLDFVIPVLAFVVSGDAGRAFLRRLTLWLIRHNQTLGSSS